MLEKLLQLNGLTTEDLKKDDKITELETIIEEQNDALMELASILSEVIDNG